MPIAEHPPAQIPAGVIHALGSHFWVTNGEAHRQLFVYDQGLWDTLIRRRVRRVCCSPVFPSVLSLGSTSSAQSPRFVRRLQCYYEEV
jgi:hypothetical protein